MTCLLDKPRFTVGAHPGEHAVTLNRRWIGNVSKVGSRWQATYPDGSRVLDPELFLSREAAAERLADEWRHAQ